MEEFVRELQSLSLHCEYVDTDDQVHDRFVVGLRHKVVKQKLQLISDLTPNIAIIIALQQEQSTQQLAKQSPQEAEVIEAKLYNAKPT